MAVVVTVDAPEGFPTGHPKDRLRGPVLSHHLDPRHPSLNACIGLNVEAAMVALRKERAAVTPRVADAPEVDELIPLDGFPAALVLPVTHLDDDVHDGDYARCCVS